jgi:GNAT superfamily N-acetyltransferase
MAANIFIEPICGALPHDFDRLAGAAARESVRNMAILHDCWASGVERFDKDGAALFGAFTNGAVIGVGGVTPEPALPAAFRVRRFYVLPDHRRLGAARALAQAAIMHAFAHAPLITCNARASAAASPFWEAMGFVPAGAETWTHELRRA